MIRLLDELTRVVAYGGGGALVGFWLGAWFNDRHRLITAVLNEAEKDMPSKPRLLSSDKLLPFGILVAMVALLLAGLASISQTRSAAEDARRDCLRSVEIADTLQRRTENYLEAAHAEKAWLRDLQRALVTLGARPGSELVRSIHEYRAAQLSYLAHLEANPYPDTGARDC